jgi:hypothetical protein
MNYPAAIEKPAASLALHSPRRGPSAGASLRWCTRKQPSLSCPRKASGRARGTRGLLGRLSRAKQPSRGRQAALPGQGQLEKAELPGTEQPLEDVSGGGRPRNAAFLCPEKKFLTILRVCRARVRCEAACLWLPKATWYLSNRLATRHGLELYRRARLHPTSYELRTKWERRGRCFFSITRTRGASSGDEGGRSGARIVFTIGRKRFAASALAASGRRLESRGDQPRRGGSGATADAGGAARAPRPMQAGRLRRRGASASRRSSG